MFEDEQSTDARVTGQLVCRIEGRQGCRPPQIRVDIVVLQQTQQQRALPFIARSMDFDQIFQVGRWRGIW